MSEDALLQLLQIVGVTLLIALPLGLILYAGALWDRTTRVARRLHLTPPPAQGPAGPPIQRIAADVRRIHHQLLSLPPGVPAARLRGWRAAYDDVLETGGFRPHLHPRLG